MAEKESGPPLGTFAESSPPPPPPRADDAADADKRFKSTLVGVPASTPPPRPEGPSASIPVLAPPPWRGAQAYLEGNIPEPRQSAVPPPPGTDRIATLREWRVETSGVHPVAEATLPDDPSSAAVESVGADLEVASGVDAALSTAADSSSTATSIRDSIERLLDEQAASGAGGMASSAVAQAPPLGGVVSSATLAEVSAPRVPLAQPPTAPAGSTEPGDGDDVDVEFELIGDDELEEYESIRPPPRTVPPAKTPSGRPIALSMPVPAGARVSDRDSDAALPLLPLDSVRPPRAAIADAAAPPSGSLRSPPPPVIADPLAPPPPSSPVAADLLAPAAADALAPAAADAVAPLPPSSPAATDLLAPAAADAPAPPEPSPPAATDPLAPAAADAPAPPPPAPSPPAAVDPPAPAQPLVVPPSHVLGPQTSLAARVAPNLQAPPSVAPQASSAGVGFLYVGLITVLGVGGYLLTRGGFVPQRRAEVRAPAAAVTSPALPSVPTAVQPSVAAKGNAASPAAAGPVPVPAPSAPTPSAPSAPTPSAPAAAPAAVAPETASAPSPAPPASAPSPTPVPVRAPVMLPRASPGPASTPPTPATPPPPAPSAPPPSRAVDRGTSAPEEPEAKSAAEPQPSAPTATAPTRAAAPAPVPTTLQPRTEPEPLGAVRDKPTREDVQAALEPVKPQVIACAQGKRGTAQADITVASSGVVTRALVVGDFAGTPEGSCMARAVRDAHFPSFAQPSFRVIYPFMLQ